MKILTGSAERELQAKLNRLEDLEAEEKERDDKSEVARLRKRIDTLVEEYEAAEEKAADDFSKELHQSKREAQLEADKLEEKLQDHNYKLELVRAKLVKAETRITENKKLETDLNARELAADTALTENEYTEKMLNAREKHLGDIEKTVTELRTSATKREEAVRNEGFKSGYADGVADGLRKVHELTAQDRELVNKLATIAIAKNEPSFQEDLGQIVKDNLAHVLNPKQTAKSSTKK